MAQNNKLSRLREKMNGYGVDYYLLPITDEYFFEYVPDYHKRLAWLTGFTGSYAYVIVTLQKAVLFTDGRYMLQVTQEVNQSDFDIYDLAQMKPKKWLLDNSKASEIIGFDPKLTDVVQCDNLTKSLEKKQVYMKAIEGNLIDSIWQDRPSKPNAKIFTHDPKYAGRTSYEKCQLLLSHVKPQIQNGYFLSASENVTWLSNLRSHEIAATPILLSQAVMCPKGNLHIFLDDDKDIPALKAKLSLESHIYLHKQSSFENCLIKGNYKKLYAVKANLSEHFADIFEKLNIEIFDGLDICSKLQAQKNDIEIQGMKNAHLKDAVAFCAFWHWLETDAPRKLDEVELSEKLLSFRNDQKHFYGPSFDTIAGAGPHGAIIHYKPQKNTALRVFEFPLLLLDSGGQYFEGTTDVTRVLITQKGQVTQEMKQNFTKVLKGMIALSQVRFPEGTFGQQLDVLARQYLWQDGQDYAHGTGHGVGTFLSVHEGPQRISKLGSQEVLLPGMTLSNEPGLYLENQYGVRLENLIYVKQESNFQGFLEFETLTLIPFEYELVDQSLLTTQEKLYLTEYHQKILAQIVPLLESINKDAADFVKAKCRGFMI